MENLTARHRDHCWDINRSLFSYSRRTWMKMDKMVEINAVLLLLWAYCQWGRWRRGGDELYLQSGTKFSLGKTIASCSWWTGPFLPWVSGPSDFLHRYFLCQGRSWVSDPLWYLLALWFCEPLTTFPFLCFFMGKGERITEKVIFFMHLKWDLAHFKSLQV